MNDRFENVGIVEKAGSGKSLKIKLESSIFIYYIGINAVEEVISGRKKTATIWHPKPTERPSSCEAHRS